jgi:hypothetical protein
MKWLWTCCCCALALLTLAGALSHAFHWPEMPEDDDDHETQE